MFCSVEHQKMIWFAHKRVCGERANPFRWPLLSAEEAEDALPRIDKPANNDPATTLAQIIAFNHGTSRDQAANVLASLSAESSAPRLSMKDEQKLLPLVRYSEYQQVLANGKGNPFIPPNRHNDPSIWHNLIGSWILNTLNVKTDYHDKAWWTPYQHFALVYFVLREKYRLKPWDTDAKAFHSHARQQFERVMRVEVAKEDPVLSRTMLSQFGKLPPPAPGL
ncbi:hypothetical protein JCM10213v2_003658 [Rhodosporidiobolus nylandii]